MPSTKLNLKVGRPYKMNLLDKFGRPKKLRNVATAYSSFVSRKQGITSEMDKKVYHDLGRNYSAKVASTDGHSADNHSIMDISYQNEPAVSLSAVGMQEMNVNSATEFDRPYVTSPPAQSVFENKKRRLKQKDEQ